MNNKCDWSVLSRLLGFSAVLCIDVNLMQIVSHFTNGNLTFSSSAFHLTMCVLTFGNECCLFQSQKLENRLSSTISAINKHFMRRYDNWQSFECKVFFKLQHRPQQTGFNHNPEVKSLPNRRKWRSRSNTVQIVLCSNLISSTIKYNADRHKAD